MSGRDSGGDLFDMAKDGTTVPEDSAKPRLIPSKPRPDQIASADDPNSLGATDLAGAATNSEDIPRTNQDTASGTVLTGTGDALPPQVDSKRLHDAPSGVTHNPDAKGSLRYDRHIAGSSEFETGSSDGPYVEKAPGDEKLSDQAATDKTEGKQV